MDEVLQGQLDELPAPRMLKKISFRSINKKINSSKVIDFPDLEITMGDSIALLGPNGCGKTSIIKLFIDRFNTSGVLYINEHKINYNTDITSLITYLPQVPVLFEGTLMENLFTDNIDEVSKLAKDYGIYEKLKKYFIDDAKIDSDTILADLKLISFLRCMLISCNRHILLLDEPIDSLIPLIIEKNPNKIVIISTHCHDQNILSKFDSVISLDSIHDDMYSYF